MGSDGYSGMSGGSFLLVTSIMILSLCPLDQISFYRILMNHYTHELGFTTPGVESRNGLSHYDG